MSDLSDNLVITFPNVRSLSLSARTVECVQGRKDGRMDRWMDEWMEEWMNEWMNEWMDG